MKDDLLGVYTTPYMTISVSLRPVGASGLLVEVYVKTKVLRHSLEKTLEEVLGCDRKEGPSLL